MVFPRHPLRPWLHALRATATQWGRVVVWGPFALLATLKALALVLVARIDLVPAFVLAPLLSVVPGVQHRLHYPDLVLQLPRLAQALDVVFFLTGGAVAQGWACRQLARLWGHPVPAWRHDKRAMWRSLFALMALGMLLASVPLLTVRVVALLGERPAAPWVAFAAGSLASMLLFVAPAFVAVHGLSLRQSIAASIGMLSRLPLALPLAVLVLLVLHVPALVLRAPAIAAGAASDPDWILAALLGQLPAEFVGSCIAAGLATYFAVRTRSRLPRPSLAMARPLAVLAVAILSAATSGCREMEAARAVSARYACERWVERAALREESLGLEGTKADTLGWSAVADLYGRAIDKLGTARIGRCSTDRLDHDLGRLACRALLGRGRAAARAGRFDAARRDYDVLLAPANAYRGARGDAVLGRARCEDRAGDWNVAQTWFEAWLAGVHEGSWPLHRDGLAAPAYVARRLRDRGARSARALWIDGATAALAAAATRGELAREARAARFALLLAASRWDEAYAALRELRARHDPEGQDGALVVAEASLLAGGLGREREAVGLLAGLHAEKSPFDSQHRVAGWLLLGQIRARAGDHAAAQRAYESAASEARSDAGRSEAVLGLARTAAAAGRIDEARRHYTQLREVWPATPAGLLAPLEEIKLRRERGEEATARALLPGALQEFRAVIQQYGTEPPALLAAQHLSECLGLAGDWERGIAFLDSISQAFGNDPRAGSLLVRAARLAAEKLDDAPRAAAFLAAVQTRYPDTDVAVLAHNLADTLRANAP